MSSTSGGDMRKRELESSRRYTPKIKKKKEKKRKGESERSTPQYEDQMMTT